MLTRHAWLAPLLLPPTISEEEEEAAAVEDEAGPDIAEGLGSAPPTADKEVAAWVIAQQEKKRAGKLHGIAKPALHTAPLDTVGGGDGAATGQHMVPDADAEAAVAA